MQIADLPRQPSLLIRISREWRPGLTDAQLYERVRRYWRINPLQRSIQPKLAYGLAEGVIRQSMASTIGNLTTWLRRESPMIGWTKPRMRLGADLASSDRRKQHWST